MSITYSNEDEIKKLVTSLQKLVKENLRQNRRNMEWFSNRQLDQLRERYEINGYSVARLFQAAKFNLSQINQGQINKDKILLDVLDMIESYHLGKGISSYVLGNLNNIINMDPLVSKC